MVRIPVNNEGHVRTCEPPKVMPRAFSWWEAQGAGPISTSSSYFYDDDDDHSRLPGVPVGTLRQPAWVLSRSYAFHLKKHAGAHRLGQDNYKRRSFEFN